MKEKCRPGKVLGPERVLPWLPSRPGDSQWKGCKATGCPPHHLQDCLPQEAFIRLGKNTPCSQADLDLIPVLPKCDLENSPPLTLSFSSVTWIYCSGLIAWV